MSNLSFKKQLYVQIARLGKAVGNGHRLELLEYLAQGERTVEVLAKLTGLSVANTSQHLQILRQSGLVNTRREGLYIHYRLAEPQVVQLIEVMGRLAASQLAEVERLVQNYLTKKDDMEPVPRAELLARVRDGIVTVLDVRPREEYDAGHVSGAINIPLKELEEHLESLPRQQDVVAYCRGPYCVLAYDAVARLRQKGFKARRLEGGYPEWKLAGLPVEETNKKS
ncbi:MAG: metalloregulator ArsR/SmtB family transcription factor [Sulfuricaulis sp.]|uniref:ArsR/SmtB family transcription factor n=1 Tax=Sulfuricaulis sp. TaxID=2003553 RepID=UPI0025DD22C1|nr:metalloregulator ArsR/SmtB family transcription factor [Sulfuricaulis sp.]MCR4347782.1 metalloregulator ArsR/SmtB family transcription factor [Sulfuricaulis sp.]